MFDHGRSTNNIRSFWSFVKIREREKVRDKERGSARVRARERVSLLLKKQSVDHQDVHGAEFGSGGLENSGGKRLLCHIAREREGFAAACLDALYEFVRRFCAHLV
jgi:hypothetical protein